ncbi:MAG: cytochrome c oxidase assembly protein [Pseudonocardia sediminis]
MTGPGFTVAVSVIALLALAGYAAGLWAARDRGHWPVRRTASWVAGVAAATAAVAGPLADGAHDDFRLHMVAHVLLGMAAPLLLVLAAPVTLGLRALPVRAARGLSGVLRSVPARVLTYPVVAATLAVGGLWLLYRTGLYAAMRHDPLLHVLVHAHVFAAGCLFTVSITGPDPAPHRPSPAVRAAVLVAAVAAHDVLTKMIYAYPPAGVGADEAEAAAQLMYYGGAPVEIALAVLLCREWLRTRRGPITEHSRRSAGRGIGRGVGGAAP